MAKRSNKKPRRTNAERSATTRGKLIAAAIETLYRSGYSATTTIEVAKRARVSRGAMLHQFPTRADLLLAVAKYIIEDNIRFRRERLGDRPSEARFFAATPVSWQVHKDPSAIALLEILMATRSDRALRRGFSEFRQRWLDMRRKAAQRMADDLGLDDPTPLQTYIGVQQACLRGLAIEYMLARDDRYIAEALELLAFYDRAFAEKMRAATQGAPMRMHAS